MEILSDTQRRALAFVAACNQGGSYPTSDQVHLWLNHPQPRPAKYRPAQSVPTGVKPSLFTADGAARQVSDLVANATEPMRESIARMMAGSKDVILASILAAGARAAEAQQELVEPAESVVEHLVRLEWLSKNQRATEGLVVTAVGKALLRSSDSALDEDQMFQVVVLGASDELAYPTLIGRLAEAGAGMFVDPYLRVGGLHNIAASTTIMRVLVGDNPRMKGPLAEMEVYLSSPSLPRGLEVRKSSELHDRILFAEEGTVLSLGTSLNAIGKTATVLTPVPAHGAEELRAHYDQIWDEAEPIIASDDRTAKGED